MSTNLEALLSAKERGDESAQRSLDRIMAAARPEAVFGAPIVSGPYTVITACQVAAGGGFGSGMGVGSAPRKAEGEAAGAAQPTETIGGGGGMGGGGGSVGRPVAVITIGPNGVAVQPIVDRTRLGLAAITTAMAMGLAFMRLRRAMMR